MRFNIAAAVLSIAFAATPCLAQIVGTTPGNNYLAVVIPGSLLKGGGFCDNVTGNCVSTGQGIPLDTYATSTSVNSQIAGVNNSLAAVNSSLAAVNSQVASFNSGFDRQTSFAAAVGAMRDAIPNDGDRFAVRGSFSAVGSAVGGGFSASANLDRQLRATINYGGSRGESVVSGGLNFSFN
jgi:hypothetical protein